MMVIQTPALINHSGREVREEKREERERNGKRGGRESGERERGEA